MRNIEKWRSALIVDLGKSIGDDDFMTRCPCHSDDKATLRVRVGETGGIVMHCFVCGAEGADVCKVLEIPINWLEPDAESNERMLSGADDPDSITKQLLERMGRTNGKTYTLEDMANAAVWEKAIGFAADATMAVAVYLSGDPARVRPELVKELSMSMAHRVSLRVRRKLRELDTPLIEVAPGVFNK